MTSILAASSDTFTYMLARAVNKVDYGGSLIRNVDALQRFAERSGLVDKWGQDKVQRYLAEGFRPLRRRRPR
jgi:hypothetical protein